MGTIHTALAAAQSGTEQARILAFGDSFVEGEGATTRSARWLDRVVSGLRSRYGLTGAGVGLTYPLYATYLDASAGWRFTPADYSNVAPSPWFSNQGNKGVVVSAGGFVEWAVTGTSADVIWMSNWAGSPGSMVIRVDGAVVATVPTGAGYSPSAKHTVSLGADGPHSLRVTASGGDVYLDGIVTYTTLDDVTYWESAHTAYTAAQMVVDDPGNRTYMDAWGDVLVPHLVIDDMVGGNEYLQDESSPPSVAALLSDRLARYAAIPTSPTVVILVPWHAPLIGTGPNGLGYTFADYVAACTTVAAAAGATIVDLRAVYPSAATQPWHDPDDLHPNDAGHQKIADALLSTLAAPAATSGSLTADTPPASTANPALGWTGATSSPTFTGTIATDTPTITSTLDASWVGVSNAPVTAGSLAATLPDATTATPTLTWSGETSVPGFTGSVSTGLPPVSVTATPALWSGTAVEPAPGIGALIAETPGSIVGTPVAVWPGSASAPLGGGAIIASAPEVTVSVPDPTWSGTLSFPEYTASLAFDTPGAQVAPPIAEWTGTQTTPTTPGNLSAAPPGMSVSVTVTWGEASSSNVWLGDYAVVLRLGDNPALVNW